MHTSKRILLTLTGLIIAFLIANMILLRQDLQWIVDREKETAYVNVPIGDVKKLQVSGLWDIRIKQAREPTLELAFDDIKQLHQIFIDYIIGRGASATDRRWQQVIHKVFKTRNT